VSRSNQLRDATIAGISQGPPHALKPTSANRVKMDWIGYGMRRPGMGRDHRQQRHPNLVLDEARTHVTQERRSFRNPRCRETHRPNTAKARDLHQP